MGSGFTTSAAVVVALPWSNVTSTSFGIACARRRYVPVSFLEQRARLPFSTRIPVFVDVCDSVGIVRAGFCVLRLFDLLSPWESWGCAYARTFRGNLLKR